MCTCHDKYCGDGIPKNRSFEFNNHRHLQAVDPTPIATDPNKCAPWPGPKPKSVSPFN